MSGPLLILRWDDPAGEHDPLGDYVELLWLPIIGPSAVLMYRRLASWLDSMPAGCDVDVDELAELFGIKPSTAEHTLVRLAVFDFARWVAGERGDREVGSLARSIEVRTLAVDLPPRLARRLPPALQRLWQHQHPQRQLAPAGVSW